MLPFVENVAMEGRLPYALVDEDDELVFL